MNSEDGKGAAKPFIYIASLRRTGSTVLAEALSLPPHAFVFREPNLGKGRFGVKDTEIAVFRDLGVDLEAFRESLVGIAPKQVAERFRKHLSPLLVPKVIRQIGIKEIHHSHWRNVWRVFPDMKVVLTGRDPRDIYLSLHARMLARAGKGKRPLNVGGEFGPDNVAANLREDFEHQLDIFRSTDCLKVTYEELVSDPGSLERVKQYVDSDVPGTGMIGDLSPYNRALHGNELTGKQVVRWKREPDAKLVEDAHKVFDLMPEYCKFWGY